MLQLSDYLLEEFVDYKKLVEVLKTAFAAEYTTPLRQHYSFENPNSEKKSTLLLMPSWDNKKYLGVKVVTVSPENKHHKLPTIQGYYTLFDLKTGSPLMQCDARLLTAKRTAAASALASTFLSRMESDTLLMIGTGYLSTHLIEAHAAVRPIKKVYIWGRDFKKAQTLVGHFETTSYEVEAINDLQKGLERVAIISTATMSEAPLVKGKWLKPGQHLDLVGSYLPTHREADDEVIRRCTLYVDNLEGACKETGDLFLPLKNELIKKEDIKGDLFQLCKSKKGYFRKDEQEITFFKSVGHALEDLATASYLYEQKDMGQN